MDTALVRAWYSWCGKTIRVLVDTALVRAWYLWCGKPIRVFVGVRWSEFRCWFPEFLDCRSHELAYRAHSTFRPVPVEQGLNNTTYLFSPEVTSSPTRSIAGFLFPGSATMRQVDQAFLVQSRRAQSRGMAKQTTDAL